MKYTQKTLFLDQIRTEVCNNIVRHCFAQDIKETKPKRPESILIKNLLK